MTILVVILGAILGSFYACMGYRIPNKISLIKPGSFCENCKKEIKWYMNIPIFSYIFLKGRCGYCKSKIDNLSFITEILTSALFLIFYLKYGFTTNGILGLILSSTLAVTIVSDFKYFYISDRVLVIAYILSTITIVALKGDIVYSLISSALMFILFILVKVTGDKAFKKESLGGGDIKLMAVIGLILGFYPSIVSLLLSSVLALIYSVIIREKNLVPFGPFLIIGALIILFFVPDITFIS